MALLLGIVDDFHLCNDKEDARCWIHSKNGDFSVKSCRFMVNEDQMDLLWNRVWSLRIPSKVLFFLWTVGRGRLPTTNLQKRGIIIPSASLLCLKDGETINHIFIHC